MRTETGLDGKMSDATPSSSPGTPILKVDARGMSSDQVSPSRGRATKVALGGASGVAASKPMRTRVSAGDVSRCACQGPAWPRGRVTIRLAVSSVIKGSGASPAPSDTSSASSVTDGVTAFTQRR